MDGKIIKLEWIPGYNISSSKGFNKTHIKAAMVDSDFCKNHGHGNYSVIKYSQYIATIELENEKLIKANLKYEIKKAFNIERFSKDERLSIEKHLPISVRYIDGKFKIGGVPHINK